MSVPYHAWTHRPKAQGGTDPIEVETGVIPWARANKTYGSSVQNIPTNSNTAVVFNTYDNIAGSESGVGYFAEDPDGAPYTHLDCLTNGIHLVKIAVIWNVTNVGPFAFGLASSSSAGAIEWFYGDTNHTATTHLEFFATSLQHSEDGDLWTLTLHHRAGADRALDAAFIHAIRLGDYTGDEWSTMDPNQP